MITPAETLAGRYRLVRLLGRGGMSDVYQAVDEHTGTEVAVKVVRAGDPSYARRLAQEARALEGLDHPALVRLLDAGTTGDRAYLVVELVAGNTLADVLKGGALEPRLVAHLGRRIAGALAYAHTRGIVHRDVKPSNILMTAEGEARLSDFGIARMADASTLTVAGTTIGTAAYMAPEQLEDHKVGPAADIWSLGVVLLECLTGRRIYEGSPGEVVAKRLAGPLVVPTNLPAPWRVLISGMLERQPEQRLDGQQVAGLLSTEPFRAAWDPVASEATAPLAPAGLDSPGPGPAGHDPTGPGPTAYLEPERTQVAGFSPPPSPPSPVRQHRGRWLVALVAVLAVGLATGLGIAYALRQHKGGNASTTTTPPSTSATTAPTTTTPSTTIPSDRAAIDSLVNDITAGEQAGNVTAAAGESIEGFAEQAVADSGNPVQAANDLQQAVAAVAAGEQNGSISQSAGSVLQSDLTALATALDLGAAASPTTAPTTPGPPHPGHHGQGNGGDGGIGGG